MSMLSKEEVVKIARLSMLELGEEELEAYREDLDSIVSFAAMIEKAQLPAQEEEPVPEGLRYREDRVEPSFPQEEVVRNAANQDFGYISVLKRG